MASMHINLGQDASHMELFQGFILEISFCLEEEKKKEHITYLSSYAMLTSGIASMEYLTSLFIFSVCKCIYRKKYRLVNNLYKDFEWYTVEYIMSHRYPKKIQVTIGTFHGIA